MPPASLISKSLVEPLGGFLQRLDRPDLAVGLQHRLGRATLVHGDAQISTNRAIDVFEQLAATVALPSFGLDYALSYPIGGSGAFGFILTQSRDLRVAVEAIARYTNIVVTGATVVCEAIDGGAELRWSFSAETVAPNIQFNSFLAAVVVSRLRGVIGRDDWRPLAAQLRHRDPGATERYQATFGPGIAFNQSVNCLRFRDANLDRPNLAADSRLYKVVTRLGDILLSEKQPVVSFRSEVTNQVVAMLGVAAPSLAAVARQMSLGQRTVQRKLAAEGVTFDQLLSAARSSVAKRLLLETDLPMTDIAFMLGYSELSAFTRAAKRWHGVPPRQLRSDLRRASD